MGTDTTPGGTWADIRSRARGWRTVDIVVAAVLGVAVGVVFWLWNIVWSITTPLFAAFPPIRWIKVRVRKPEAPIAMVRGYAAVELHRVRGEA